jgi:modified peptide precursor CbpA
MRAWAGREDATLRMIREPEDLLERTTNRNLMVKGFDGPLVVCRGPFCLAGQTRKEHEMKKQDRSKKTQKDVIASRKRCKAEDTGLSHYILMDKKAR